MAKKRKRNMNVITPNGENSASDMNVGNKVKKNVMSEAENYDSNELQGTGTTGHICQLSLEVLCQVFSHLPLPEVMKLESLCKKFQAAASLHLRLLTHIDFTNGKIIGWMPKSFTDATLYRFLSRCPDLLTIHGLHTQQLLKRRQRNDDVLSIPGVIVALSACPRLVGVQTSDIFLLEAILRDLPHLTCAPFQNRNGRFPISPTSKLELTETPRVTSLELTGVVLKELPKMEMLRHLHLQWVEFSHPHPFREFGCPLLRSFVMMHCAGPVSTVKYVPLITALASAPHLNRLELIRVPFLGGMIQHVVEDTWKLQGFRQLHKISMGACKHAMEVDLGYLVITCSHRLSELRMQPSLTKDSFFSSLTMADVDLPVFETLHLGFVDDFPESKWSSEELVDLGLAETVEHPSMITDLGMKAVAAAFPNVKHLHVFNCPHLHYSSSWFTPGGSSFHRLRELHLRRCHALRLTDLRKTIPLLVSLESLTLEEMFREPPKGCSRVGLSAGTGLGVSSALVQNNSNDVANQANNNNNNPPGPPPPPPANQAQDNNQEAANQGAGNNGAAGDNGVGNGEAVNDDDVPALVWSDGEEVDGNGDGRIDQGVQANQSVCACCGETFMENSADDANSAKNPSDKSSDKSNQPGPSGVAKSKDSCKKKCTKTKQTSGNEEPSNNEGLRRSRRLNNSPEEENVPYTGKGKSLRGKKKGIVKKSKSTTTNQNDQSCQATSEEIRETTKKAKENGARVLSPSQDCDQNEGRQGSRVTRSGAAMATRNASGAQVALPGGSTRQAVDDAYGQLPPSSYACSYQPSRPGRPSMVDMATSTSDPVIEEDFTQILTIQSSSLVSLTLMQVGITDLVLNDCPKLQVLTGSNCRVLKDVLIKNAPRLSRVSFAHCAKLHTEDLVDELCMQPAERNRIVYLRPVNQYDRFLMERELMHGPSSDYHFCLIHDYSPSPEETLYNRNRASAWLDIVANINYDLTRYQGFKNRRPIPTYWQYKKKKEYPWFRHIHRMQGLNANGSGWELVTDLPWLRHLTTAEKPTELNDEKYTKAGVYYPEAHGHTHTERCLEQLEQQIAEAKEEGRHLHQASVLVYINMCDMEGGMKPDRYV